MSEKTVGATFSHIFFDNDTEVIAPLIHWGDYNDHLKQCIIVDSTYIILDPVGYNPRDGEEWVCMLSEDEQDEDLHGQISHKNIVEIRKCTEEEVEFWYEMTERDRDWITEFCEHMFDTITINGFDQYIPNAKIIIN